MKGYSPKGPAGLVPHSYHLCHVAQVVSNSGSLLTLYSLTFALSHQTPHLCQISSHGGLAQVANLAIAFPFGSHEMVSPDTLILRTVKNESNREGEATAELLCLELLPLHESLLAGWSISINQFTGVKRLKRNVLA